MILAESGEVGVHVGEDTHVLRPTLYAMTQLGEPEEIVRVFASVMEGNSREQFFDALAVIFACCGEGQDLCEVFGFVESDGRYHPGRVPVEHIFPIARCLMKHGITGALPPLPARAGEEPEYETTFVARDYVAMAIAHLGIGEREAWGMTMTTIVGALRAKFPPTESSAPGARAPTKEQHEKTMAWFDAVEAKRLKKLGTH